MDFIHQIIKEFEKGSLVEIESMVLMVFGEHYKNTVEDNIEDFLSWFFLTSKVVVWTER